MSELEPTRTYSNPTATDVLRRMLDERGVEWGDDGYPTTCTVWASDGIVWHGLWRDDCIELIAHLTPEQVIAATLGSCNCSNNCTDGERTGTCHVQTTENWLPAERYHRCESCGAFFAVLDASGDIPPRACPNCGRRIEQ